MGFALIGFGLLLTIAGARNSQDHLFSLLWGDFTGKDSFLYWVAAIGAIGGIGYVQALRPLSHAFLALIFVVFVLAEHKKGHSFFADLQAALGTAGENSGGGSNTNSTMQDTQDAMAIYQTFGQ